MNITEQLVSLDSICEEYFNIKPKFARRKATLHTLPVPAFRLTNTERGPFYVLRSDLETYLQQRVQRAKAQHSTMTV